MEASVHKSFWHGAMHYQSKILDHLGLPNDRSANAAMYDELEIGPVIDRLVPQDFEQRTVTVGEAVKAMVLWWLRLRGPAA